MFLPVGYDLRNICSFSFSHRVLRTHIWAHVEYDYQGSASVPAVPGGLTWHGFLLMLTCSRAFNSSLLSSRLWSDPAASIVKELDSIDYDSCLPVQLFVRRTSQMFGVWTVHMWKGSSWSFPLSRGFVKLLSCLCVIGFRWLHGNLANMLTPAIRC